MRPPAHVTAFDLLRDFRAAVMGFRAEAQDGLMAIELDIRRAFDWLAERRQFWQRQVRSLQDEVTHAKAELAQRKMVLPGDRQPDCSQQLKALRLAQQRLEHAEQQVERAKRWEPLLRRAVDEYEGPARQLGGLLDADLPKSAALLDRLLASLEAYIAATPSLPSPGFAGEGPGVRVNSTTPSPPAPLPQSRERGEERSDPHLNVP